MAVPEIMKQTLIFANQHIDKKELRKNLCTTDLGVLTDIETSHAHNKK